MRIFRNKKFLWVGLVVLVIGLSLVLWAFFIEPNSIKVHSESLNIPHWNAELNGLRVVVLTDLHVGSPHVDLKKLQQIVSITNDLKPDLIVLLGDLVIQGVVGGSFVEPEKISDALKNLQSPLGSVAVLGNHDWWFDGMRITKSLEKNGIQVLENSTRKINFRNSSFWLAGIADMWTRHPLIQSTLQQIPSHQPIIVLTHNPDIFPDIPDDVSLTLAGHTHGGQVNVPMVGRPIVPSKYGQRYAAGSVVEQNKHMFVGTGIGTSIIPVRFRVVPEILLLSINGTE